MQVTINGETKEFQSPLTIGGMLEALAVVPNQVAVEVNRCIVPKSTHAHTELKDGDVVELVRFIGGG